MKTPLLGRIYITPYIVLCILKYVKVSNNYLFIDNFTFHTYFTTFFFFFVIVFCILVYKSSLLLNSKLRLYSLELHVDILFTTQAQVTFLDLDDLRLGLNSLYGIAAFLLHCFSLINKLDVLCAS